MNSLTKFAALAGLAAVPSVNTLRVASAVQNGETFTIGTQVFEIQSLGSTVTVGRKAVDLTASPTAAKAAKLLTFGGNPTAADTVSINGQVYTFRASLTTSATANEVLIGADLTATRNNLLAAVNLGTGAGTLYGSATVINSGVTAVSSSTNALNAVAKIAGTAGNSIVIAEAGSNTSWASAATALSGGVDPTAVEAIDAIVIAINGTTCGLTAVEKGTEEIFLQASTGGNVVLACTETLAGSNNGFVAAASYGGADEQDYAPLTALASRAAVALEVTLGQMRFAFNFAPRLAIGHLRTSAGVLKAWDGATTISGNVVTADVSGSADFAAGDLVYIIATR